MKKTVLILITLLLVFSSCLDKKESTENGGDEICFSLPETRASSWQFATGDKIGVYAVERIGGVSGKLRSAGNYADNKCFKYSGRGFVASTQDDKIYNSNVGLDYYVYYPYSQSFTNALNMMFFVKQNQNVTGSMKANDMLITKSSPSAGLTVIPLLFDHQFTLLEVTFRLGKGKTCNSGRILSRQTGIQFNLSSFTSIPLVTTLDVQMYRTPGLNDRAIFQVLLPVQSIEKDSELFSFTVDGENRNYTASQTLTLRRGTKNTYDIALQYNIDLQSSTGGRVMGSGKYNCGTSVTVRAFPSIGYMFEGWYDERSNKVSGDANYTFEVDTDRLLTARYALESFAVDVSATRGGTVSGGGSVGYAGSCTVIATESAAYTFNGWYENGALISTSREFTTTVYSDRELEARFTPDDVYVEPRLLHSGYLFGTFGSACAHLYYYRNGQKTDYIPEYDLKIYISFKCIAREKNGAKTEKSCRKLPMIIRRSSNFHFWDLLGWDDAMVSNLDLNSYTALYHLSLDRSLDTTGRRFFFDDSRIGVYVDGHGWETQDEYKHSLSNQRNDNF